MADVVDESACPQCGQPLSTTVATSEAGDQLAVERMECPHCGAPVIRDVDGHADRGWRLDEEAGG